MVTRGFERPTSTHRLWVLHSWYKVIKQYHDWQESFKLESEMIIIRIPDERDDFILVRDLYKDFVLHKEFGAYPVVD